MNFKEIRTKLMTGDFSGLFQLTKNKQLVHPNDVAKLFASLPHSKAIAAFNALPEDNKIRVFSYLDHRLQEYLIHGLPREKASFILNGLTSDDRLLFFSGLKAVERSAYIELLNEKTKAATHSMLGYPKQSIARLINTDFATIKQGITIGDAMVYLRKNHKDTEAANVIYIVDKDGKLVDDIPVRRFVLNDPNRKVDEIFDGFCTHLNISDNREQAVAMFKQYDRTVLPVTDDNNFLLGVLTVDDVLDIAEQRDTADIQKFGGLESLDYPYVKTSVLSLVQKRAGWLIILFLSEMLTATAMGKYADEISKAVVLALFVPLIMSSGGNSGSQAATLIIRAMSLKEITVKDWWFVMRREIISGLLLGIVLGSIGFIRISVWQYFHWYDYGQYWMLIASTIFFSLIGIILWGTLSGSMVPMVLKRCKLDPATSSAPFVATLVDVTGLIIYFSIAAFILKGKLL